MNACASVAWPLDVSTVTSTVPLAPAGVVAANDVADDTVTDGEAWPPNLTVVCPSMNALPIIVTMVPPDVGPAEGAIDESVGAVVAPLIDTTYPVAVAAVTPMCTPDASTNVSPIPHVAPASEVSPLPSMSITCAGRPSLRPGITSWMTTASGGSLAS